MSSVPPPRTSAFYHASDLPEAFWAALRRNEFAANTILPFATKARHFDRGVNKDQLWIIVYDETGKNVEFILSCTKGSLGNYPIFVYTPKSSTQLAQEESCTADSLLQLVHRLLQEVSPQRVFSVFAVAMVAEIFAKIFEAHTNQEHGIRAYEEPYYDATFTFCTSETLNGTSASFSSLRDSEDFLISLCLADASNLEGVATLCKGFAATSPPYTLDDERAQSEAEILINNKQVWVHMIKQGDDKWDTACIVATTRESENVTAITKVFTAEKWRGHGCAARLTHRVCQDIFQKRKIAVLYVANSAELAPARKVYHKIGFQGLSKQQGQPTERVAQWLEIGFKETTLGYW